VNAPAAVPCGCALGCILSGPCGQAPTQEDWLCDQCRAAKAMNGAPGYEHCHACGDEITVGDSREETAALVRAMVKAAGGE
jgi:hypothetical protein